MTISFFVLSLSLLNLLQFHYIPFSRRGQKQQDCMHLTSAVIYTSTEPPFSSLHAENKLPPKNKKSASERTKIHSERRANLFCCTFFES